MKASILASGSKSNCYAFSDGTATIQIECGLPVPTTLERLRYRLPDAILVTHEHCDHARYAKNFLERGVEMFMTAGTAQRLRLKRHNLHIVKAGEIFNVCGHRVTAFEVKHDAQEPVNFAIDDEILFVTDVGKPPEIRGRFKKIFVEANYDIASLLGADIPESQKQRVRDCHLSIRQTANFLRTFDEPEEVWLIHLSKRHGNGTEFVERVKAETNFKNVFAAETTL